MRLRLTALIATLALSHTATHADTMRRVEAPARADRTSPDAYPQATLPLPAGIPAPEPVETDSLAGERSMAVGYAVCGLVILGGIILMKAASSVAEKAASETVEGIFGPVVSGQGGE